MPNASVQPVFELKFLEAGVSTERRADGSTVLRTEAPCAPPAEALVHGYLQQWALARPRQIFLAERSTNGSDWQTVSYAEAFDAASRLATAFAARGLGPQRPILILSGNGITHQLVALAAMMAGVPYTPLSVAYSTMSGDLGKLRGILKILDPGLVFAADAAPFARALAIGEMRGRALVVGQGHETIEGAIPLQSLLATPADEAVLRHASDLPSQTVAKILFTSGSTGTPKGVPTTHLMMCTSLSQIETMWPFMRDHTPDRPRLAAVEPRVRRLVQRQYRAPVRRHALY
jgi:feruloyl-CoA synthase